MATSPPMGLRNVLPGSGFSFGADGGAVSGVNEILQGSINDLSIAPNSLTSASLAKGLIQRVTVNLSSAQILALNATPIQLIAAPASGQSILVDYWLFRFVATATQYAAGGAVGIQFAGGSAFGNTVPAATVTSASSSDTLVILGSSNITLSQATALQISNATAAFTTGTGTATVIVWYSIV